MLYYKYLTCKRVNVNNIEHIYYHITEGRKGICFPIVSSSLYESGETKEENQMFMCH